jgi:hypothetical protein
VKLHDYMVKETVDSNLFWRLDPGEHLNLLDEAIDRIEDLQEEIAVLKARHERDSKEMEELLVDLRDKTLTLQDVADLHRGHGGDVWCPTERIVYLGHGHALDGEES